jgi:hypothetical protein
VACPVFGQGNRLVGALSVSGPRYRIEALGEEKIVPVLFKYSQALTRTFGGDINLPAFAGWLRSGRQKARPRETPARRQASTTRRKRTSTAGLRTT